jgi:hypothetical protein
MLARWIIVLVLSSCSYLVKGQVPLEIGEDLSAYKHKDDFTMWQKISDASIKGEKINSVYYRTLSCHTIANKVTGKIAHPFAMIEVKAPEQLKGDDASVSGFLIISGEITELVNNRLASKKDTIKQFFRVSPAEPVFSVETVMHFVKLNGIYLSIFDNDISEVYSKEKDKGHKNNSIDKKNALNNNQKIVKNELSDTQAKRVFDLIFGPGSSSGMTISDQDKLQAANLLSELIKGSCNMALVEGVNRLDASLLSFVRATYTAHFNCRAAREGAYYEIVRKAIANNFKSTFQLRKEIGEW